MKLFSSIANSYAEELAKRASEVETAEASASLVAELKLRSSTRRSRLALFLAAGICKTASLH
jgi:hypothetical protein